MNATLFGRAASQRPGMISNESTSDPSSDVAWMVLEAANDFGDDTTIEACRRVIDASLSGTPASPSDLHVVSDYFR
jgi:hypothetical protein